MARSRKKLVPASEWSDTPQAKAALRKRLDDPGPRGERGPSGLVEPEGATGPTDGKSLYRFHMLGMAHLPTLKSISPCAYTQKIVNLCRMLKSLGHTVYHYGVAGSQVDCDEFVEVVSEKAWRDQFGGYDWKDRQFDTGEGKGPAWDELRRRSLIEIKKRVKRKDFVLCPMGHWHKEITDALGPEVFPVESGIGYSGVFSNFRVFESYAWMHYIYGLTKQCNGQYYDCVIPNYYDPEDFPFVEKPSGDYYLYIGRLVTRKGVQVAVEATQKAHARLIVAGQRTNENLDPWLKQEHVTYAGVVTGPERAKLMGNARAVLVPTFYIEPFGGVAVEAALVGAPVIASDFGAFTETVNHGLTGWRCATLAEFVWAIKHSREIMRRDCHAWAVTRYSLNRVRHMYQHYFNRLAMLWDTPGWPCLDQDVSEFGSYWRLYS